jgi:hypothetical protein
MSIFSENLISLQFGRERANGLGFLRKLTGKTGKKESLETSGEGERTLLRPARRARGFATFSLPAFQVGFVRMF